MPVVVWVVLLPAPPAPAVVPDPVAVFVPELVVPEPVAVPAPPLVPELVLLPELVPLPELVLPVEEDPVEPLPKGPLLLSSPPQ